MQGHIRKIAAIVMVSFVLLLLTACGGEGRDGEVIGFAELPEVLEGEITILVPRLGTGLIGGDWRFYVSLFNEIHPNVQINFQGFDWPADQVQQAALTTRLLTDPPDLLCFWPGSTVSEKTSLSALFVDLNPFLDGPRGIDRNNYFNNIFKATEAQGGLFNLPLYVQFDFGFLNRRIFEGLGLDPSQVNNLTIDEEINLTLLARETFPYETIHANPRFSILQAIQREPMYNLDTNRVYINTPQMYHRMTNAMILGNGP